jgi:hypothetical protein
MEEGAKKELALGQDDSKLVEFAGFNLPPGLSRERSGWSLPTVWLPITFITR